MPRKPNVKIGPDMSLCIINILCYVRTHLAYKNRKFIRCYFVLTFFYSLNICVCVCWARYIESHKWCGNVAVARSQLVGICAGVKSKFSGDSSGKFMWKCTYSWCVFVYRANVLNWIVFDCLPFQLCHGSFNHLEWWYKDEWISFFFCLTCFVFFLSISFTSFLFFWHLFNHIYFM